MEYTAQLRSTGDFGLALQQARFARGKSQTDVARELGISQSMASDMESGRGTLYLRRLLEIAQANGLTFSATWEGSDASGS